MSASSSIRVAVFGAGAVGAYYGKRLGDGGAEVTLIARGRHLDALRRDGLTIVEPEGTSTTRLPATDDPARIGPVDVVLFCVKSYDTDEAARRLGPLLREDTAVISLQNGIDNEDRIAAAIGREHVVGGAAYILAAVREPGVVEAGGPRQIVIGELEPGQPSERVQRIVDLGRDGGLTVVAAPDVRVAIWEKYVLLVAFSAMSASVRLGIGAIREAPAARAMLGAMMSEAWAIGRATGVPLADDLVERQMKLLLSRNDDATASLYHDLVTGHRMETDALQGAAIRLGREHGIPTPSLDAAYAILEPWTLRNARPVEDRTPVPA
ncbi:MAG TPA: ketopantoate reductase family protein [Candidatus Limnocylindrales bacterium]|nr:ketopantoate reductase family protein [Candidatus Limnocylindrales bacterium]